jgi:hypothetical protein
MARNLITASGNLILGEDKNLILSPLRCTRKVRGRSHIYSSSLRSSQVGSYQVGTIPGQRNLVIASGNLTLGSNKNLVLGVFHAERKMRGHHQVFQQVQYVKNRGAFKIYEAFDNTAKGYSRFIWETFNVIRHRGAFRIINPIQKQSKAKFHIKATIKTIRHRGAFRVYESYPPLTHRGGFGIKNTFLPQKQGRLRIANDSKEGFTVYIGYGEMPDFSLPPALEGASLPLLLEVSPPASGTLDLYIVKRTRNKYGLESQNQFPQVITIDNAGNQQYGLLSSPLNVRAIKEAEGMLKVFATYEGITLDSYPADKWQIFATANGTPDPATDTPVTTIEVNSKALCANIGAFAPGTVGIAVTMYREADSAQSTAAFITVTIPEAPTKPIAVKSGFEVR